MTISLNANHQNRLRVEMNLKNKASLTYALQFELASYDATQKWQLSIDIVLLLAKVTLIRIDSLFVACSLLYFFRFLCSQMI